MGEFITGGGYKATPGEWLAVAAVAVLVVGAAWFKFGSDSSDYQRLERLEERVSQLEVER